MLSILAVTALTSSLSLFQAAPPAGGAPAPAGSGAGAPPAPSRPVVPARPTAPPTPGAGRPQAPTADPALGTRAPAPPSAAPPANPADANPTAPPTIDTEGQIDAPPPIEAEPGIMDFGFIAPRATAKGTFKLKNKGDKPLKILAVQASCKCTSLSDLVDKDIPVGGSLPLDVEMSASPLPAPKKASVKILVDGYQRVLELQLVGEVAFPIRALPGYLNIVANNPKSGRLVVESIDKKPFSIVAVSGTKPDFIGFDPAQDEPRNTYLIKWDMTPILDKLPGFWVIQTDREDCPLLPVKVRHETTIPKPSFRMKEFSANLGVIEPGGSSDVELEMEDPGERIVSAQAITDQARAELISTEVKDGTLHAHVKVTPRKGFTGFLYFPLAIYSAARDQEVAAFGLVQAKGAGKATTPPATAPQASDGSAAKASGPTAGK